jgi:elongation factor G
LFFQPAGESDFSSVADAHSALVDQVVEVDEALMSLYLEQGEISATSCTRRLKRPCAKGTWYRCVSSRREMASESGLLDIFVKLLPNPAEGNPPLFIKGEGENAVEFRSEPDPKKHVLAHVFKVVMDPFVGKLGVFRVHQGTVTRDTQLFVGDNRKPFKVGHLFMLQGGKNVEIDSAVPGDIAAVAKVDEIEFDCVSCTTRTTKTISTCALWNFRRRCKSRADAEKRGDEQRIWEVLHRMTAEDPTLVVERSEQQRDRTAGAGRVTPALGSRAHVDAVQARDRDPAAAHPVSRNDHRAGGGFPSSQEADRRRRPVR